MCSLVLDCHRFFSVAEYSNKGIELTYCYTRQTFIFIIILCYQAVFERPINIIAIYAGAPLL
jgi:hypothetical protein